MLSGPLLLMDTREKPEDKMKSQPKMLIIALLAFFLVPLMAGSSHASGSYTGVKAEEILNKIEMGQPVEYDQVLIEGDLNLSNSNLSNRSTKKILMAPLKITQSMINGSVNFNGVIFSKPLTFSNTIFRDDVSFINDDFQNSVNFEDAEFVGEANFGEAKFQGYANYNRAKFMGGASFYLADFKGDSSFYATTFYTDINFNKAEFNQNVFFDGSQFMKYANFEDAKFDGEASFYQAKFNWNMNFANANFNGMTYFNGAYLGEASRFENIQSKRYLNFEGTKFIGDVSFKSAQSSGYISLRGAHFNEKISLDDSQLPTLQIEWDSVKDHLVYNEAVYVFLIKNFESLGYFRDADNCYYQYRQENQAREILPETKAIDILAWLSCGYGVRPIYTLALSFAVIFLFGIFFWTGKAMPERANLRGHLAEVPQIAMFLDCIYFSAISFLTPHASVELRPAGHWKYLVLLEHIIGWLLMALFLVTLGKVMIR